MYGSLVRLCLLLLLSDLPALAQIRVLYVNSYHRGYPWSDDVERGLTQALEERLPQGHELYVEYLDAKRHGEELRGPMGRQVLDLWESRYKENTPQLVLVSDQDGYEMVRRAQAGILSGIPVVYTGVESPGSPLPHSQGISRSTDVKKNLDFIQAVMPHARRIWIITDHTAGGMANRAKAEAQRTSLAPHTELKFFDTAQGLNPAELLDAVIKVPPREAILFLDYAQDREGRMVDMQEWLPRLCEASRAPVFSHVRQYIDYGVTGGFMNSGYLQGRQMAHLGIDLALGKARLDQPPQELKGQPFIDYRGAQRHGIQLGHQPPQTTVLGRPEGFWHRYGPYALLTFIFLLVQSLLLGRLYLLLKTQKRAEEAATQNQQLFSSLFELAPYSCVLTDLDGRFVMANQHFLDYVHKGKKEVLGKCYTDLHGFPCCDEKCAHSLVALRSDGILKSQSLRWIGPDGEEMELLFSSRLLDYGGSPHALSIVLDSGELHKLRESLRQGEERQRMPSEPKSLETDNEKGALNERLETSLAQ